MTASRRIVWLLLCVAAGVLVGAAGHALTGDARWYLALAATFAAGWLVVANPMDCDASTRRRDARSGGPDER
jgi:hypothetical protein